MFKKIKDWYVAQSGTTKALIILGILLIIGILLRWEYVWDGITRGFNFYSNK